MIYHGHYSEGNLGSCSLPTRTVLALISHKNTLQQEAIMCALS